MERNAGFSPRLEVIAALALLALVALLRSYQLGADPPLGLSISTGEQTDPPQYTLFARNYVQTGDFDPFDDARRAVFLKSSVTALAVAVFSLLGAGLWQAHLVGLLLGLAALVLFWLFMRKVAGPLAGLLFLFLAAFNYNLIFFGRLPFLEQALVFWAFLAAALLAYGRRPAIAAAAGASLALGITSAKRSASSSSFPSPAGSPTRSSSAGGNGGDGCSGWPLLRPVSSSCSPVGTSGCLPPPRRRWPATTASRSWISTGRPRGCSRSTISSSSS